MKQGNGKTKIHSLTSRLFIPWIYYCLGVLILGGCYEPREGCLDIQATNFEVDADWACQDCCTWPEIRLRFFHRAAYPDTLVNFTLLDSVYKDIAGDMFRTGEFKYLLGNLRLVRPDGAEISLVNQIPVRSFQPDGSLKPDSLINDILLLRPGTTALLDAGNFRASGQFVALRLDVGVSEKAQLSDPASLPTTHPMNPGNSGMEWDLARGYEFQRVELLAGSNPQDTARTRVKLRGLLQSRTVELPLALNIPEGKHLELDVQIDYLKWLSGIRVNSQTPEEMGEALISNTQGVFSVVAFRYMNN